MFAGTLIGLLPVYGGLRIARVPKLPARILAVAIYLAWVALVVFDLSPWPVHDFTKR